VQPHPNFHGSLVNVAMAYCDDVDKAMEKCKASVLMSDRHSKVGPEELSRK
jgi:hypothetical protein